MVDNTEHNYNVLFARQLYKQSRLDGSPPIHTFKVYDNTYFVESKDGIYREEQVNASCAWEAKWIGSQKWLEMKGFL